MYKKFSEFKIKKREGYDLTLKVDGYREYLSGNHQLLDYERVRYCLQKSEDLRLILTEVVSNNRDKYFPPLFKMDKTITYPIKHVKFYQLEKQMENNEKWKLEKIRQEEEEKINKETKNKNKRVA